MIKKFWRTRLVLGKTSCGGRCIRVYEKRPGNIMALRYEIARKKNEDL